MTLREKLGQLMLFGFTGTELTEDAHSLITEYKAGNIILFSRNLTSISQTGELCASLKACITESLGIPPLIGVDEEGGSVSRLPKGATHFPSALALAAAGSTDLAKDAAFYLGRELSALGINWNFAPVCDINTNPDNPVIGVRAYGSQAGTVSDFAFAVMAGYAEAGIMTAAKHFPGHGDTSVDSHLDLPRVEHTEQELEACELIPFKKLIAAGVPSIMVSHIVFPRLDLSLSPASLSPQLITGLLRGKLGYEGLVVTDCLEMGAIKEFSGTAEAFTAAIRAGADMGCISHSPDTARRAIVLAEAAVKEGSLSAARVDEALSRVIAAKKRLTFSAAADYSCIGSEAHRKLARSIARKAICRCDNLGALPPVDHRAFFAGPPPFRSSLAADDGSLLVFAPNMAARFDAAFSVTPENPEQHDIERLLSDTEEGQTLVLGTCNAHMRQGQLSLINCLARAGRRVIALALRNTSDLALLEHRVWKLAVFDYSPDALDAAEAVLRGEKAEGRL